MVCVSYFLFSAGCTAEARSTIENNTITNIINRVTQSTQQSISNLVSNYQKIEIINEPTGRFDCNLNLSQSINAAMKVDNKISSQQSSQIKNDLKEVLVNETKTIAANNPSLWQSLFAKGTDTKSVNEVINNLTTNFDNTISQETIAQVLNSTVNSQEAKIYNRGIFTGQQCNITQDLLINFQASNLIQSVQSSLLTNQVFRDIQNKLTTLAGTDPENAGKKGGGKGKIILIVLLVILGIAIIGGIVFALLRKKGGGTTVVVTSAAPAVSPVSTPVKL
jgi:hypothetical protein